MIEDEHLDALIDATAREMTGAIPDERFTRQVAARIAESDAHRHVRRAPRTWLWVPAAACIVLVAGLVAVVVRPRTGIGPVNRPQRDAVSATPAIESASLRPAETAPPSGVSSTPTVATRESRPRAMAVRALPATAAAGDPDLQPMTTTPLDVAAIQLAPLVTAMPIEISTIAIDRIEIAAMP